MGEYFQGVRNAIFGSSPTDEFSKKLQRALQKTGPLIEYPEDGLLDENGNHLLDERTRYLCEEE